jgi:LemA protein
VPCRKLLSITLVLASDSFEDRGVETKDVSVLVILAVLIFLRDDRQFSRASNDHFVLEKTTVCPAGAVPRLWSWFLLAKVHTQGIIFRLSSQVFLWYTSYNYNNFIAMSLIVSIIIVLLILSGLFSVIPWSFNIPALVVVFVAWLAYIYNNFVRLINRAKEAWSDIDVQLKRRYDLIPNLVETVKGYAGHESKTLEEVTRARTMAMGAQSVDEHAKAENMLSGALKSLFAVSEAYPDLKANQNFLHLQQELSDTENKIQAARRFYNSQVRDLNIGIESFPGNIIAGAFSFKKMEFFELTEEAARNPVAVKF